MIVHQAFKDFPEEIVVCERSVDGQGRFQLVKTYDRWYTLFYYSEDLEGWMILGGSMGEKDNGIEHFEDVIKSVKAGTKDIKGYFKRLKENGHIKQETHDRG